MEAVNEAAEAQQAAARNARNGAGAVLEVGAELASALDQHALAIEHALPPNHQHIPGGTTT